ncbi:hypothetical protein [Prescottella agglutinans]|nr:hypothetical protein [Prescottella agglutinans]
MDETAVYLSTGVDVGEVERIISELAPAGYTAFAVDVSDADSASDSPETAGKTVTVFLYHLPEDEVLALADQIRDEVKAQLGAEAITEREVVALEVARMSARKSA